MELSGEELTEIYQKMLLPRRFDERFAELYRKGKALEHCMVVHRAGGNRCWRGERAMKAGASLQELLEAAEASVVPGWHSNLL